MSDIPLSPGHRYTFAKVDTRPVIIDSTDHAEGTEYFRNDVQITGSVDLRGRLTTDGNTLPIILRSTGDARIQFTSSNNTSNNRWVVGLDSNAGSSGINTFVIHNGASFITNADFRVSGSTIKLDFDNMPTDADLPLNKGTVYRSQSGSQHFLLIAP